MRTIPLSFMRVRLFPLPGGLLPREFEAFSPGQDASDTPREASDAPLEAFFFLSDAFLYHKEAYLPSIDACGRTRYALIFFHNA